MSGFRAGFVAILGAPSAGKSTLLNRYTGQKIAIVSPKPQTTRNRIVGIVNGDGYQLAFVDTPGVNRGGSVLLRHLMTAALAAIDEVDAVMFVVDAADRVEGRKPPEGEAVALDRLRKSGKPSILALNKIDRVAKPKLLPLIDAYQKKASFAEIVPVSALRGDGCDHALAALVRLLPQGEPMFPKDTLTDQAERQICAELVREQILSHLRREVPYAAAVVVEEFDETQRGESETPAPDKAGLIRIEATIYVERDSQKGIVIGKRGQMLKTIGTAARAEIERFLGSRVYLGLTVRVEEKWSESERALAKLGVVRS